MNDLDALEAAGYHIVQDEQAWMAGDVYDLVPSPIDPDGWRLRPVTENVP